MPLKNLRFSLNALSDRYWLTRFVYLRMLGVVYFFAFLSLALQVLPLLGSKGLTPAYYYLNSMRPYFQNNISAFWQYPTVFWFHISDSWLLILSWLGLAISLFVVFGYANKITMLLLWALYMSFVHIGQVWYSYGWETELLENGFLAIFLVPLFNLKPFSRYAPPALIIFLLLWLAFRVNIGAGLIKLRGDSCWRDFTCLYYHFQTQPIPNPLSPYFHFLPHWILRIGVAWTHIVQLGFSWLLFIPGVTQVIAGCVLIFFQLLLMASGNLSFLNIITIAPLLAAFSDKFWMKILPRRIVEKSKAAAIGADHNLQSTPLAVFILVLILSAPAAMNLLSSRQFMNASFNQFDIANSYGAFGVISRQRYELVVSGTADELGPNAKWKEYEFLAKPTNPDRPLPIIAPYQPRLDWQMWFAAMERLQDESWLFNFIWKLLHNDKLALQLIKHNPFCDSPPKYIKIDYYLYQFESPGSKHIWKRQKIREWLKPVSIDTFKPYAKELGFNIF